MKFESFGDFFKYNKELFEDDYNKDQALVVKTKSKATDNVTVSPRPSPFLKRKLAMLRWK
jgi:hypothetical protein